MPGNARLTDIWCGVCVCCPGPMCGPIITSSPDTNVNNLPSSRLTDITIGWCGHPGVIVTCSPDYNVNNLGTARCTDLVTGCNVGAIVTCSPDTIING